MSVIWSGVTEEGAVVPVQVTAEGKVVAVGDGPEGDYLKLTGGNLTGDLTLGSNPSSPNISLNADGSGIFNGSVTTEGVFNVRDSGKSANLSLDSASNTFQINTLYGNDLVLKYASSGSASSAVEKVRFQADGRATFSGDVIVNDFGGSGSGRPAGICLASSNFIYASRSSGPVWTSYTVGTNDPTSTIGSDGSAEFAGGNCGFTSAGELYFTSRNTRYKLVVSNGVCVAEEFTRQMELKEKADQFIADKRETKPSDPQVEVTPDNDNA